MNASKAAAAAAEAGTEEEGDNLAGLMGIKSIFAVPLQEEEGTSPEARQIPRVTGAVANGSIALKKKTATAVVPVKSYDFDAQQGPTRSLFRNAILFPVSSITYATSRREPSVWNQVFLSLLSEGTKGKNARVIFALSLLLLNISSFRRILSLDGLCLKVCITVSASVAKAAFHKSQP